MDGEVVDLDEFDAKVVDWIEERRARGEPAFINALGVAMGDALRAAKTATGLSFTAYLRARLGARYDIVQVKQNTDGLVPKGGAQVQPPVATHVSGRTPRKPRYVAELWQAFAEPLRSGRRFYVPSSRSVVESEDKGGDDWIEIPPDLIRTPGASRTPEANHVRIEEWVARTGVDLSPVVQVAQVARPGASTILDALVAALSPEDMRRVLLPLDIVAELTKRRL